MQGPRKEEDELICPFCHGKGRLEMEVWKAIVKGWMSPVICPRCGEKIYHSLWERAKT
jgi:RecJ-like exonuclease